MPDDNISKLPEVCAAYSFKHKTLPILISRGEQGYVAKPEINVVEFNRERKVTSKQVEAMICGSMFGWDKAGANPDICTGKLAEDWV